MTLPSTALVRRELVRNLRGVLPFLALVLVVCTLGITVFVNWPHYEDPGLGFSRAAGVSRDIVEASVVILLIVAGLLVPGHAATAILLEREQRTYDLMITTLISPWGIIFGKIISAVGYFFLLLFACAPVIGSVFFLIGLDWIELGIALALLFTTTFSCASIGLFCSTIARRVVTALFTSYFLMFVLMGGPIYVLMVAAEIGRYRTFSTILFEWGAVFCPIGAMAHVIDGDVDFGSLLMSLAYQVCVTFLCLLLAYLRLRRPYEEGTGDRAFAWLRGRRSARPGGPPGRPALSRAIPDDQNPVFALESRWGALTGRKSRRRLFIAFSLLALLILGFAALSARRVDRELVFYGFPVVHLVIFGIVSPSLLANTITSEFERENIDLLRMTLLSPSNIVFGKWKAGLRAFGSLFGAALVSALVLVPLMPAVRNGFALIVTALGTLAVTGTLSLSLSIFVSVLAKRTLFAIMLSYGICSCFYFAFTVAAEIGFEILRMLIRWRPYDVDRKALIEIAMFLCPPVAYFRNMEGASPGSNFRDPLTWYWAANVLFHGVFSLVLVWFASGWFAWRRMREK